MRVDLFYLTLPNDKNYRDDIFTDENVNYFNKVNGVLYNLHLKDNGEYTTYLYAFTNNKDIADRYEDSHDMRIFTRIHKKISKKEWDSFKKEYMNALIVEYDLSRDSDNLLDDLLKTRLLCTKNEIYEITDSLRIYVDEQIVDICSIDYHIFNNKYFECLDLLFYCTLFGINNSIYSDEVSYGLSYGVTAEGFNKGAMSYGYNLGVIYIKLFSLLLRKD